MKRKNIVYFGISFVLLCSFFTSYATNYVLGYSSVDAWEIRWWGSTIYSSQLTSAISTWNALWRINIAPDTITTYEDLTIRDVSTTWLSYYAQHTYYPFSPTDEITVSTVNMNSLTNTQRQNVLTHELGHALGLAHSISQNIMVAVWELDRLALWAQDKYDYYFLWY